MDRISNLKISKQSLVFAGTQEQTIATVKSASLQNLFK